MLKKLGPLEEWMTNHSSGCLKNPTNSITRQKDMTPKDELPRLEGVQYATGEEWRANQWTKMDRNGQI